MRRKRAPVATDALLSAAALAGTWPTGPTGPTGPTSRPRLR